MGKEQKGMLGRRGFFRLVGAGAAMGTVAPFAAPEAHADNASDDEKRKARYRESNEVKTYYRVNSYPKK